MEAVDDITGTITKQLARPFSEIKKGYTYFANDDVLFAKITPCMQNGKHVIARGLLDGFGFGTTEFHVIRPGSNIIPEWLHFFIRQPAFLMEATEHFTGAVGQQRLPADYLANFEIPLPPLSEQKRIAAILNEQMAAVERARKATEERLVAIRALPAACLRQVFPQPDQELPEGWRWVKLEEVISEAQSGFACGERDPKGVIQLRMNNVDTRGNFVWNEFIRVPANIETFAQYQLAPEDVLFNNTNSTELVGKSAFFTGYQEPVVYSNHFTRLRTDKSLLTPIFLAVWLNHQWIQGVFANICNRWIGQSAVKSNKLLALDFPLPPLPEQKRIAAILNEQLAAVERARKAAEDELAAINALPAALLRRAFAGEV